MKIIKNIQNRSMKEVGCSFAVLQGSMEGMFFGPIITIIMQSELIIKHCILFLQDEVQFRPSLSLKVGWGEHIYKLHGLDWSSACKRWQRTEPAKIPWPDARLLQLEVYYEEDAHLPTVIAQGELPLAAISACLRREIKIGLMLDGLFVGSLYCKLDERQEQDHSPSGTFLYVHKIDIILLEDIPHAFQIQLLRNEQALFDKQFHLHYKIKTLFPNLKIPVSMSDVITIAISHCILEIKEVKFVADSVRRGKTSFYQAWLRNPIKNKVGDIKIEYFLDNLFLENQRQIFMRNGIYPNRIHRLPPELTEIDKDKLRRSVIIRQIEEADRRILKISTSLHKLIKNMEEQERPTPNKQKHRYSRDIGKENTPFKIK